MILNRLSRPGAHCLRKRQDHGADTSTVRQPSEGKDHGGKRLIDRFYFGPVNRSMLLILIRKLLYSSGQIFEL
jgi:hypothetical protein